MPGPPTRSPLPEEAGPSGTQPPAQPPGPGVADNLAGRHPLLAALLTTGAGLAVALAALWLSLPDVENLARVWPERTAYMELRLERAARDGRDLHIAYDPVPLSRVPAALQRAVLVAEDAAFYGHGGFDWHELGTAIREAWEERSTPRGASTITQQLARNLYLSPRQSMPRKAKEALIAWKLERTFSKRRILELYLNVIELGPGIFGVEAASRHYFGVGVESLGPRQAAELAATIPSPLKDNPASGTRRFHWRADLVFRRAFGPAEQREEIAPPPDSLAIEVEPPTLPAAGLPAPDTALPSSPDTAGGAPRADTTNADTTNADTTRVAPGEATDAPPSASTGRSRVGPAPTRPAP